MVGWGVSVCTLSTDQTAPQLNTIHVFRLDASPRPSPLWSVEPVGDMEDLCVGGLAGDLLGHRPHGLGWLSNTKQVVQDASPVGQGEENGPLTGTVSADLVTEEHGTHTSYRRSNASN